VQEDLARVLPGPWPERPRHSYDASRMRWRTAPGRRAGVRGSRRRGSCSPGVVARRGACMRKPRRRPEGRPPTSRLKTKKGGTAVGWPAVRGERVPRREGERAPREGRLRFETPSPGRGAAPVVVRRWPPLGPRRPRPGYGALRRHRRLRSEEGLLLVLTGRRCA